MMSSTEPRWTFAPRVTPAAAASASASSAGTTIVEYLSLVPWSAALTSSMGMDVRVDQKLMTGTNGMDTSPAGAVGVGVGVAPGEPLGVGVGPLTGALGDASGVRTGRSVGVVVVFDELTGEGKANEPPGAVVGGVDEPHAATKRASTAAMTSRFGTDRVMAVDLTDKGAPSDGTGGPDRIRTGDLQRDRLACLAATPRVREDVEDSRLSQRPPTG